MSLLEDEIKPTPRNYLLGLLADAAQVANETVSRPAGYDNPPARMLMSLLGIPAIAQTLDRLSYGEPLTTGKGMTTKLRPETTEAVMSAAGIVGPAAKATERAAMAAGRAGERIAERVVPQVMERGGLPAEMMQAMGQGTVSPLTVYHGTPHKFERFDPTKIGSGEGAQAYGYGHYVAESPGVARAYRNTLSQGRAPLEMTLDGAPFPPPKIDFSNPDPKQQQLARIRTLLMQEGGDVDRAIARTYGDDVATLESLRGRVSIGEPGSLYTIDLPDSAIARMLDWDKPLSQQTDIVKSINPQSLGLTYKQLENGNHAFVNSEGKIIGNLQKGGTQKSFTKNWTEDVLRGTGRDLYRQLGQGMGGGPKVSSALREAGIPGIRYLDQGSRGARQGTSNFVIFPGEEELLRMLERNGVPMTSLLD